MAILIFFRDGALMSMKILACDVTAEKQMAPKIIPVSKKNDILDFITINTFHPKGPGFSEQKER
jgi:hypothetical protein